MADNKVKVVAGLAALGSLVGANTVAFAQTPDANTLVKHKSHLKNKDNSPLSPALGRATVAPVKYRSHIHDKDNSPLAPAVGRATIMPDGTYTVQKSASPVVMPQGPKM